MTGPGWVERTSGRSWMGRVTLWEVRDGSGDAQEDLGRDERPSHWFRTGRGPLGRSWTGWGILAEVRDGLGDPLR